MIQASNSARGEDFANSRIRLRSAVGQGCSLAKAGDALLQASVNIQDARLPDAAAELQRCVQLLRAADGEPTTRQVDDSQMKAVASRSVYLGCYQVCELYVVAGYSPAIAPACCSAFELMEQLINSGRIEADIDFLETSARAAAAAYASQLGSGDQAKDVDMAARARSALQVSWAPGASQSAASFLIAESIAWARLDEAVKARAALGQAIELMEASGHDVAGLRAIAAKRIASSFSR